MFMIITFPWPVPSANADLPGVTSAVAAARVDDAMTETSVLRPSRVEDLVCWTVSERLRIRWYRLRLATGGIYRAARRAAIRGLRRGRSANAAERPRDPAWRDSRLLYCCR